ncbi:MAG: tetratricopeptide repeat protein [Spirochaetales bacterium]|nr:tetratricopeptide repeat protein [Spirochaetales bacterium]
MAGFEHEPLSDDYLSDHPHQGPDLPDGTDLVSELSKKGYNYLKEGVLEEAQQSFLQLLELDAKNNYALVGLGDVARKKGDFEAATGFYQECLRHFPTNNYALFGLADSYKAMGLFTRALAIWEEYLKQDSANITVLTRVADAYRKVRSFNLSKVTYLKVLEMEPNNAYALIGLGHLHYDFKDYREALRYWEQMYHLNEDHADIRVLTSLGNCHRKMKTYADGIPYFQKVLDKHPDNFYALFGLADCYRGLNLSEQSLEYWQKILSFDPNNKVILTRAGDSLRSLGRLDEAEGYYRKALNIEFDLYAVLGLALVHKLKGEYQEAINSLQGILKNDANNARIYQEMAECYVALKKKDEALAVLSLFQKRGMKNQSVNDMMAKLRALP